MSYYVYSTLANDMKYVDYHPAPGGIKQAVKAVPKYSVLINGKVGVANKNLITPRGAITKITDEDYEMLKGNGTFQDHVKNGYITCEKKSLDVDKVVVNMKRRDVSAPITPEDYEKANPEEAIPKGVKRKRS